MKKINIYQKTNKIREKILNSDISYNILNNYNYQLQLLGKLYLNEEFKEKKFIELELKSKLNSYKSQDKKKDIHENLITFDELVSKLLESKLLCKYCNQHIYLLFDTVRNNQQWTLDRLNNLDEHTNLNTVIACLKCNIQRKRINSEKFKFTKQLTSKNVLIKKLE